MKIIVPIRRVPDPGRPIRVTAEGHVEIVHWMASREDEAAVDEAVRLAGGDGEVVAVSTSEEYLLSALARGGARGIYLSPALSSRKGAAVVIPDGEDDDITNALVEIVRREQPDLILLGSGDETGPRLAGALGTAQATRVSAIEVVETGLRVTREMPRRREVVELTLPAVLTLATGGVPKIVSLYAIVDAREKPIDSAQAPKSTSGITVIEAVAVPSTRLGKMLGGVDELVAALREEAMVI